MFFESALPEPVTAPRLAVFNDHLATELGLISQVLKRPGNAAVFTGNKIPRGAKPIAQAYAGHQYGGFTGLGDGRAILLGEHITPDGGRFDVQLKGPGRTRFSRGGDGRAALGPMLREFLISEAMHALGIPTTRGLAVATTGETVLRERPLPGAVLTRVAASHIRVGTFQWAAAHEDIQALEAIAHYTRRRHFPHLADAGHFEFFQAVLARQAELIARWMLVGFVHGVMNTDNMALSGETIDYGPCAFMEAYDSATVFSSIDRFGRYAYGQQPTIARWNLARFAEAMLPLLAENQEKGAELANEELGRFMEIYEHHWLVGMRAKIGLVTAEEVDRPLIDDLLSHMHACGADFTNTFRSLAGCSSFPDPGWHVRWQERMARENKTPEEIAALMRANNPAVIPRNHKVEEALEAASADGNLGPFHNLLAAVRNPYAEYQGAEFTSPSPVGAPPYVTYCGT